MINEFIEKIIVHAPEKVDGDRVQEVEIYLSFIGRFDVPTPEPTEEEIKRQEQLKRHRIRSRERYQEIKAGKHKVGEPYTITCKICGKTFESHTTLSQYCSRNCCAAAYRQREREKRSRECTCSNCGKVFTAYRSDVKYCSEACRYEGHLKGQKVRNAVNRAAKKEDKKADSVTEPEKEQEIA